MKVDFHVLRCSAATDTNTDIQTLERAESGVKDYMLDNYNNLINSDVICCQKWSRLPSLWNSKFHHSS